MFDHHQDLPHTTLQSWPFSLHSLPLVTTHLSSVKILSFQNCYISGITQCVTFCDWLFFTQHNALKFIQVVECISSSFLILLNSILWYGFSTICLAIHPLKDTWVSSLGVITNKADVNIEHLCTSLGMDICCHFSWVNI